MSAGGRRLWKVATGVLLAALAGSARALSADSIWFGSKSSERTSHRADGLHADVANALMDDRVPNVARRHAAFRSRITRDDTPIPVPEPSTLGLLAVGALTLLTGRRGRAQRNRSDR